MQREEMAVAISSGLPRDRHRRQGGARSGQRRSTPTRRSCARCPRPACPPTPCSATTTSPAIGSTVRGISGAWHESATRSRSSGYRCRRRARSQRQSAWEAQVLVSGAREVHGRAHASVPAGRWYARLGSVRCQRCPVYELRPGPRVSTGTSIAFETQRTQPSELATAITPSHPRRGSRRRPDLSPLAG